MKKFFLFAAAALMALVGCEKQVQSSLDLEKVEKEATVSGTLVAYVNAPGQATQTIPLEGVRVYIQVASSEYATNANEGNQQFESKTDAEGRFTIYVKTGAKEIGKGTKAKFKTDDFSYKVGDRTIYYEALDEEIDPLNAGDFREEYFVAEEDAVLNQTIGVAVVKGRVTYDAGFVKKADGTWEEKTHAYAPNANIIASVTYFKGETAEVVKKFTAKSNANGEYSFNIPVEEVGNDVALVTEQFQAKKTTFENNEWVTRDYYFDMTAAEKDAAKISALQANTTQIKELNVSDAKSIPDDKKLIKFNVVGKIFQQVEEEIVVDKILTGYTVGTTDTKYTFTVRLDYYDEGKTKVESSIVYEGNSAAKEGAFSVPVELYDGWKIDRVKVLVYADKTEKVSDGKDGYTHYYYEAKSDHSFPTEAKNMTPQSVSGIYKGGKDNVLVEMWAQDKNIFFNMEVGDKLSIPFEAENPAKVLGRMNAAKSVKDGDGGYSDSQTVDYTEGIYIGGDDAANLKYYKKADVYPADLIEKGDKKILHCMGGTGGLW